MYIYSRAKNNKFEKYLDCYLVKNTNHVLRVKSADIIFPNLISLSENLLDYSISTTYKDSLPPYKVKFHTEVYNTVFQLLSF